MYFLVLILRLAKKCTQVRLYHETKYLFYRKTPAISEVSPPEFQKRSEQFLKPLFRFAKKPNTVNKIKIFQKGLKYFLQNQMF